MLNAGTGTLAYREAAPRRYVEAALLAGAVAVGVNLLIYLAMALLGGPPWSGLIVGSIAVASLLPNLLAGAALFAFSRFTPWPRLLMTLGVAAFVLISILPHLGIGPPPSPALAALPESFDLLTVPLHLVFGLTAILLLPRFVRRA